MLFKREVIENNKKLREENKRLKEENEILKEKLENIKNWVKELRYGSDGAIDVGRWEVDILLEILGVYKEYYNRTYTGPKTLNELWSDEE